MLKKGKRKSRTQSALPVKFLMLFVLLLCWEVIPLEARQAYKEIDVANGGAIIGVVHFQGDPSKAEKMEITKDKSCCGAAKVCPRLDVGKNGVVRNAVIYLEGIAEGKTFSSMPDFRVNQKKCEYEPHITLVPLGKSMEIANDDPILHNVHAYYGMQTAFNIAQPIKGQRTRVKQTQLSTSGTIALTCDAGHPWMSGYVFVIPHPYYAVTDNNGRYRLDNIPPGKFTLMMWHEGVAVVNKEIEKEKVKKYIFEEPYEVKKEVIVNVSETISVDFDLVLR